MCRKTWLAYQKAILGTSVSENGSKDVQLRNIPRYATALRCF